MKNIIKRDQVSFISEMQGWFKCTKVSNYNLHYKQTESKNSCDNLIRYKNSFDKIQYPFMICLEKNKDTGAYINILMTIYRKSIAKSQHQIQWGETLNNYTKIRTIQSSLLFPYLFNIRLENLARILRLLKEIQGDTKWNKRSQILNIL